MADKPLSFTQLTHHVVRDSPEPLTAAEIVAQVDARRHITTKNPKQTIRGAISNSRMIVATGDGHYAWKTHVINGSLVRHTLSEAELSGQVLHWEDDIQDLLWPTFFAIARYSDRSPAKLTLPTGDHSDFELVHYYETVWGTQATPAFWSWLQAQNPIAGDHLLCKAIDSEARQYEVTFAARVDRDETVIGPRNIALFDVVLEMSERPYGTSSWELTSHLLATGFYQHPVPPDPLGEVWVETAFGPRFFGRQAAESEPAQGHDAQLSALFGQNAQVYDPLNPPDLPPEYQPETGRRRARPSLKARRGSVSSTTFRVSHRALPDVWRDIQLAEDQNLEDLHLQIQSAYNWYDDHLYSFFVPNKEDEQLVEIGSPWSDTVLHTHQVQIGQLNMGEGETLLYLFDYGDYHEFDVQIIAVDPLSPKGKYPKLLDYHGASPQQYPDDDNDEDDWSR